MINQLPQLSLAPLTDCLLCRLAKQVSFSIILLLTPIIVLGEVAFPANPQTRAECKGLAAEMRALVDRARALRDEKYKEADAKDYDSGGDKYRALMQLMAKNAKEYDREREELYELEKTCNAAAKVNEDQPAAGNNSRDARMATLKEAKEIYEDAKEKYNQAKELGSFLAESDKEKVITALKYAKGKLDSAINSIVKDAYTKRNDAYSEMMNEAMDDAKGSILNPVPKSPIVGAIQKASFEQLKMEMQQSSGTISALMTTINNFDSGTSSPSTGALKRGGGNSGSSLFQQGLRQAAQDDLGKPAREARALREKEIAAEKERLARIKEAEDARAYERALAEKSAQDARDNSEALSQILGAIVQIQKNEASQENKKNQVQVQPQNGQTARTACLDANRIVDCGNAPAPPPPASKRKGITVR